MKWSGTTRRKFGMANAGFCFRSKFILKIFTVLLIYIAHIVPIGASFNSTVRGYVHQITWISRPDGPNGSATHGNLFDLRTANGSSLRVQGRNVNETWLRGLAVSGIEVEAHVKYDANGVAGATDLKALRSSTSSNARAASAQAFLPRSGSVKGLLVYTTICGNTPQQPGGGQSFTDEQNYLFNSSGDLAQHFSTCSHGKMTLDAAGSQFVTIDLGCPYGLLGNRCPDDVPGSNGYASASEDFIARSIAALADMGVDISQFRFVYFSWPAFNCPWCGLGWLNDNQMLINGGCFDPSPVFHESGHNLGLSHALTAANIDNGSCCYDGVSKMGGGGFCYNVAEQWGLGWDNPVELSLSAELAPGNAVLRGLANYISSDTAGLKVALPSYPGYTFYFGFVANAGANYGGLKPEVADKVEVIIWSESQGQGTFASTQSWAMLGPGDSFEYDSLVMRVHAVVPAVNSSVFSICRKGLSNPCSDPTSILISPGVQASVGVEYYSGSLYGLVDVIDAAACAELCAGVAKCGGWTVDVGSSICWMHDPSVPWTTIANPNAFSGRIQASPPTGWNSPPEVPPPLPMSSPPPPARSLLTLPHNYGKAAHAGIRIKNGCSQPIYALVSFWYNAWGTPSKCPYRGSFQGTGFCTTRPILIRPGTIMYIAETAFSSWQYSAYIKNDPAYFWPATSDNSSQTRLPMSPPTLGQTCGFTGANGENQCYTWATQLTVRLEARSQQSAHPTLTCDGYTQRPLPRNYGTGAHAAIRVKNSCSKPMRVYITFWYNLPDTPTHCLYRRQTPDGSRYCVSGPHSVNPKTTSYIAETGYSEWYFTANVASNPYNFMGNATSAVGWGGPNNLKFDTCKFNGKNGGNGCYIWNTQQVGSLETATVKSLTAELTC